MSAATESSPLLPTTSPSSTVSVPPKPQRTVTFNPTVLSSSPKNSTSLLSEPAPAASTTQASSTGRTPLTSHQSFTGSNQKLSALNTALRRRHSQGAAQITPLAPPAPKIGPQRTTRVAQKLKLLPNPEQGEDGPDEESGRDVYSQFTRIKDPTARRDAARLSREDREWLPRVTAYCTAGSYQVDGLLRFLKGKSKIRGTAPKLFDECIYTPYAYSSTRQSGRAGRGSGHSQDSASDEVWRTRMRSLSERRHSDSAIIVDTPEQRREDLIDLHTEAGDTSLDTGLAGSSLQVPNHSSAAPMDPPLSTRPESLGVDIEVLTPEVFLFNYGTVVIWGMTKAQEHRFLKEIARFENEKLETDDVQTEDFNFYYTREYQARIYNDFISLMDKKNYMTKLAISHALSQSVKTSLYEDLVDNTIALTKEVPTQIAQTGKVNLTRREINMQIGELFILRINIHLQGSVLDAPELLWAEPQLNPVYQAVRSYLEMDQRVGLLTERLEVIADLLAVLKDQLSHTHGEYLEWIVIVLIAAEILVAGVNILVDLYAGVD